MTSLWYPSSFIIFLISSQYFKKHLHFFSLMVGAALPPNGSNVKGTILKYLGWQLYSSSHILPQLFRMQQLPRCSRWNAKLEYVPMPLQGLFFSRNPAQIRSIHNIFLLMPWYQAEFNLNTYQKGWCLISHNLLPYFQLLAFQKFPVTPSDQDLEQRLQRWRLHCALQKDNPILIFLLPCFKNLFTLQE